LKTISIRKLRARAGKPGRQVAEQGRILVADYERAAIRTASETAPARPPYFASRQFINPKMKRWIETGALGRGGMDVTTGVSNDREDRG